MRLYGFRVVMMLCLGLSVACGRVDQPPTCDTLADGLPIEDDAPDPTAYHLDLERLDATEWVELSLPQHVFPGFTLVLYERRIPMILDMDGRIVHAWPLVRAVGRYVLDRCGRLSVLGRDNLLKEYDWDGNLRWSWKAPGDDFPHHCHARLENLNYLVVVRDASDGTDYVAEVDRDGDMVWVWRFPEDLAEHFPQVDLERADPTHVNSAYPLPPNPWFDAGDERFRPGNVLVSARNLNSVFIVDRDSGSIVWRFEDGLDLQHEAIMIRTGEPMAGHITLFNNGYHNRGRYRHSAVWVVDPVAGEVVRDFQKDGFFSSVAGAVQPLSNGNLLVSSSQGGRVFEVAPDDRIVWEWVPPFRPMVAQRYAPDHCPQLEALGEPTLRRVWDPTRRPFVDAELFALTLPEEHRPQTINGNRRAVVPTPDFCRAVRLPPSPTAWAAYGLHPERVAEVPGPVRFRMTLEALAGTEGEPIVVVDDLVAPDDDETWKERTIPFLAEGWRRYRLCVRIEAPEGMSRKVLERTAMWANPKIMSSELRLFEPRPDLPTDVIEDAIQEQHLKALGYIR